MKQKQILKFSGVAWRYPMTALVLLAQVAAAGAAITNTATVNGDAPDGNPAYAPGSEPSDSESVGVVTKSASYTANKTVASIGDEAGEDIVYRVTLVNTGNVTIDTLSVTDPGPTFNSNAATNLGSLTAPTIISESDTTDGILQVGETIIYEFQYTLSQTDVDNAAGITNGVDNTATVTAEDPDDVSVPPTGTLTVEDTIPDNSALTLDKSAYDDVFPGGALIGLTQQNVGDVIYYRFTVTNTGNTTITNATITDGPPAFSGSGGLGTIALVGGTTSTTPGPAVTEADLAPIETAIFEVAYTVTQTDVDNQ